MTVIIQKIVGGQLERIRLGTGVTGKTLSEWAEISGVNYKTLFANVKRGMLLKDTIEKSQQNRRHRRTKEELMWRKNNCCCAAGVPL